MVSTRRRYLQSVAGVLAVAGIAGLSGCSSSCPDGDRPTPEETISIFADSQGPFETAPAGVWNAPHGDAGNTGYADVSLPENGIETRWRTGIPLPETDSGGLSASPPTVGRDAVFVADERRVHALSKRTGEPRWQSDAISPTFHDTISEYRANTVAPAVGPSGDVYVGTTDGLVALDGSDGSIRWTVTDLRYVATPAVVDGVVYASGADHLVSVTLDGEERWRRLAPRGAAPSPPAVGDDRVVYAADASVVAVDTTGTAVWERRRQTDSQVVIDGTNCYVGNTDGLHAIALASGEPQWTFDRGEHRALLSPVVTPETFYVVEQPGEAGAASFALDRLDGEPTARWCSYVGSGAVTAASRDLALTSTSLGTGPDAAQTIVAFTADFGTAMWAIEAGSRPRSWLNPPALLDGAIVVTTRGGTVAAMGGRT